ncbi:MAG: hypothetical protein IT317_06600 [Anaerolineales bacterium]|nr:hypothetical protein [Anaerolineales bacterium]
MVDAEGRPLPLKPGVTWFEFVPLNASVTCALAAWEVSAPVLPEQTPGALGVTLARRSSGA